MRQGVVRERRSAQCERELVEDRQSHVGSRDATSHANERERALDRRATIGISTRRGHKEGARAAQSITPNLGDVVP